MIDASPTPVATNATKANSLRRTEELRTRGLASRNRTPFHPFAISAVVASGDAIGIVTLNWTGRSIRLAPTRSMILPYEQLAEGISDWIGPVRACLRASKIHQVVVRRGAYSGQRQASRLALEIETALQLEPQLQTITVHTNSVAGWMRRSSWLLPLSQRQLNSRERKLQVRCIETASFGVWRILKLRSLSSTGLHSNDDRSSKHRFQNSLKSASA